MLKIISKSFLCFAALIAGYWVITGVVQMIYNIENPYLTRLVFELFRTPMLPALLAIGYSLMMLCLLKNEENRNKIMLINIAVIIALTVLYIIIFTFEHAFIQSILIASCLSLLLMWIIHQMKSLRNKHEDTKNDAKKALLQNQNLKNQLRALFLSIICFLALLLVFWLMRYLYHIQTPFISIISIVLWSAAAFCYAFTLYRIFLLNNRDWMSSLLLNGLSLMLISAFLLTLPGLLPYHINTTFIKYSSYFVEPLSIVGTLTLVLAFVFNGLKKSEQMHAVGTKQIWTMIAKSAASLCVLLLAAFCFYELSEFINYKYKELLIWLLYTFVFSYSLWYVLALGYGLMQYLLFRKHKRLKRIMILNTCVIVFVFLRGLFTTLTLALVNMMIVVPSTILLAFMFDYILCKTYDQPRGLSTKTTVNIFYIIGKLLLCYIMLAVLAVFAQNMREALFDVWFGIFGLTASEMIPFLVMILYASIVYLMIRQYHRWQLIVVINAVFVMAGWAFTFMIPASGLSLPLSISVNAAFISVALMFLFKNAEKYGQKTQNQNRLIPAKGICDANDMT